LLNAHLYGLRHESELAVPSMQQIWPGPPQAIHVYPVVLL
jgi:hypothetical protein